ncbi:MAG: hypothetical protein ACJASX_003388, partial [Limisphaerales bacterium]
MGFLENAVFFMLVHARCYLRGGIACGKTDANSRHDLTSLLKYP